MRHGRTIRGRLRFQTRSGGRYGVVLLAAALLISRPAVAANQAAGQPVSWGYMRTPRLGTVFTNLAAGANHSLAVQSDGSVLVWGANYAFFAPQAYLATPAPIPADLSNVVAVAPGMSFITGHGLALKSDGTVAAWGDNTYAQATVSAGFINVIAVAAGEDYSLALKNDGSVCAWGYNYHGETNSPAGMSGVVAIAAGRNFCLALKDDGTVAGWG